ncbi:glycosyltransferase family 2 protein [Acrodontium crateriforme]|uniref:chitin synthase n=1 Tax=Acrodontium crateriforme TaxID=150365 RepID=A0AAQ3LWN2_9PEZI|nr:glycosyltransferase family 2 protein [Acrodontium crateriforme]
MIMLHDEVSSDTSAAVKWRTQDIVYVAIVGSVMLAAVLEWVLWLLAFLYCLFKVFQKANGETKWSVRILAVLNAAIFIALRCIFLPIMVVTLPLPSAIVQKFPEEMVGILQWFAFWSFSGLLVVPWLFCVYQLVTQNIGRTRRIKSILDEQSAPKVVIIMPCYNELPAVLLRTVDSIVDCAYPPSCMHIFLSFDGDREDDVYLNTLEALGVPLQLDTYPRSVDVTYRSCRVTVSRFPHGGKRSCQKHTFKLIDKIYAAYLRRNDDLFLLFIDSDCILDKNCIQNFMWEMNLKPASKNDMLAMTGVITSTTEKHSFITILQDMEYIHGQLFERSVESSLGAVTCLPGALTMLRFSAFRRMAKYYFADKAEQCDDLFDFAKCHLGEDRWLTHLLMIGARKRYQIQMCTNAFCKTEAVQTMKSLLKQRRRWFLGFITNEACMLTDIRLWKRYPLLLLIRLAQNTIRTTALLFFIMIIAIVTTSQTIARLPVGFIAVSLGLNWVLMLYFGAKLGRYKIMMYPLMFVFNPFLNWLYMVYGIFTAGKRTWGGPRADAGKANEHLTPKEVVEQAEKTGDELNIVPETFKPAIEAKTHKSAHNIPLQPPDHLRYRFTPADELPGGWYQQNNDSGVLYPDMAPRNRGESSRQGRISMESNLSDVSTNSHVYTPRRVESIFSPEDARKYHEQQSAQRPAGGAFLEPELDNSGPKTSIPPGGLRNSPLSTASNSSVSLHFTVPQSNVTASPRDVQSQPSKSYAPPGLRRTKSLDNLDRMTKSPLARKSFTRLASPNNEADPPLPMSTAEVLELERQSAAQASMERQTRALRTSADERRRPRKLSKQRPGSRDSSRRRQ